MIAELGNILFFVVNLSYFLEINPEFALTNTTEKFINRFRYIENSAFAKEKQLTQMTLEEMDQLWQECKMVESTSNFQYIYPCMCMNRGGTYYEQI